MSPSYLVLRIWNENNKKNKENTNEQYLVKNVKVKTKNFQGSKQKNSPKYLKTWPFKKDYTCKECEDELNLKEYLTKHQ